MYSGVFFNTGPSEEPPAPIGDQIDDVVRDQVLRMKPELLNMLGTGNLLVEDVHRADNWSLGNEPSATARNNLLIGPDAGRDLVAGSNNVFVGNARGPSPL